MPHGTQKWHYLHQTFPESVAVAISCQQNGERQQSIRHERRLNLFGKAPPKSWHPLLQRCRSLLKVFFVGLFFRSLLWVSFAGLFCRSHWRVSLCSHTNTRCHTCTRSRVRSRACASDVRGVGVLSPRKARRVFWQKRSI